MNQQAPHRILTLTGILYLFFNSFLLPEGLLYTTLLTPFFFIHLLQRRGIWVYLGFLCLSLILAAVQYPDVQYFRDYVKSFVLIQCVAIFAINTYYVIRETPDMQALFKVLASVNMVLLGFSLCCLFIPVLRPLTWFEISMSEGLPVIPRLKMFTYEASYYSLIMVPLFAYYFLRRSLTGGKTGILLITLAASMLLSLSFGVLACLLLGIVLVFACNLNELGRKINLNYLMLAGTLLAIALVLVLWLNPDNQIFGRIRNIFSGKDASGKGRTTDSFVLAWNIAKMRSVSFGIGLGQLKIVGRDYIIQYYHYSLIPAVIRIPNAVAETLNIYGLVGLVIRFAAIGYGFFKTRVWNNYYRLLLFIFIFIYQFTGSFLFNVAEYVIWALAFSPGLFPQFNRIHFLRKRPAEADAAPRPA